MKVRQRLLALVGPSAGALSLSLLARTLSIRREEAAVEARWRAGLPTIYAVWHGRLALMPWLYARRDLRVLISRSRDGEIVAALIRRFGFVPVRGSSSTAASAARASASRPSHWLTMERLMAFAAIASGFSSDVASRNASP